MTTTTLDIQHQRIDDIPLLIGLLVDMGVPQQIDRQIQVHGLWQGISVGMMVVIWLCYLLTEHDHRLVAVREWAKERREMFNRLLGVELRETDLTDDRLAKALSLLGNAAHQTALDQELMQTWITLYELPTEVTRHDSTTVSVYQEAGDDASILGYGHSKDHRPDLAQFKVMLATLDPLGLPLTCQVVNGKRADDGLYIPSYESAVATLGHRQVLAVGDSKMGALSTRAYLVEQGSSYLCAFRQPAADPADLTAWVEQALAHPEAWQILERVDEASGEVHRLAQVYAWERTQRHPHSVNADEEVIWTERLLVTRSAALQSGLTTKREQARQQLYTALERLTRPGGRGRPRYRQEAELSQEVTRLLDKFHLTDIVEVTLIAEPHPDGGQRWRVAAYHCDEAAWQRHIDRLGWTVYLSTAPTLLYTDLDLVLAYRAQPRLEQQLARLKTRTLHIRPVFLRDEQRIQGLTWLLFLALRVLVLLEFRVRRELAQRDEVIVGLNPASLTQATRRPTAERLLKAFGYITFSVVHLDETIHFHVTPLTALQQHILSLLNLSDDIYSRLADPQPKPLFNLRE
jgi:transposase